MGHEDPPAVQLEPAVLRKDAIGAWATMDAGPNVKVLCERANADKVAAALREQVGNVVVLGPGGPATLIP